ncbi:TIGR03752 family integrating conjugative element protein [Halorhodospira abdelmalekii]|uniref:TIGR03752 family integrating conjugative element protein n=1 Tax=Halorhodospira abdelmalekii TaxID=421629 RepID=UPI001F5B8846|nr:TIGR03752 family integrating conjugative element protein [Halorhodospira abdelmalekii]
MASKTRSNRLLPILGGLVGFLLLVVILVGGEEETPESATVAHPDELGPGEAMDPADVDTQADTIRMLTAQNRRLEQQLKAMEQALEEVEEEAERPDAHAEERHEALMGRIEQLTTRVKEAEKQEEEAADETDWPVGLGLAPDEQPLGLMGEAEDEDAPIEDGLRPSDLTRDPEAERGSPSTTAEQLTWIDPLDASPATDDGSGPPHQAWTGPEADASASEETEPTETQRADADPEELAVYTVPRNSMLMGSSTLTALIGRIPREGSVEDAAPFKVVVGSENLAANDMEIPGLEGMILSGTAFGDWTLSCVRGTLHSATFLFEDGTTRTFPDPGDGSVRTAEATDGSGKVAKASGERMGEGDPANPPIGYITDPQGVPCIAGDRVSNAPAFLAQAGFLAAGQAASEALAQAETETMIGQQGFTQTIIDGDTGRFIGGRAASGAAEEVLEWLRRRQENHFDAIFTPAGQEVTVHIDRELRIDYEPDGRRVSHDQRPDLQRSLSNQPFERGEHHTARPDRLD